tara:strand:- start:403 stop:600 length:198 start_codon:yes stop_codon:yes gene_type:complete
LYPPAGKDPSSIHYFSTKTGKAAIGVIVDSLEGSDGFVDYEVLVENEKMWFPDIQLQVITSCDDD